MLQGRRTVERAAVEVAGAERHRSLIATDPAQPDGARRRVDRDHVPALAVVDARHVDSRLHPVADREGSLAHQHLGPAQLAFGAAQRPRAFVQEVDVAVATGDHHRVGAGGEVAMPVGEQAVKRARQIVADDQPALGAQQVKRLRAAALVDEGDELAVGLAALAADRLQLDRLEDPGQVRVEAARPDRADLARVADHDQLPLAGRDQRAQRLQVDGRGRTRLIDDDHRAPAKSDPVGLPFLGAVQQGADRGRRHPGVGQLA